MAEKPTSWLHRVSDSDERLRSYPIMDPRTATDILADIELDRAMLEAAYRVLRRRRMKWRLISAVVTIGALGILAGAVYLLWLAVAAIV